MKLTSDLTLDFKNRKIVTFFIEKREDCADLALKLCSVFKSPDMVVTSPLGEHRLPSGRHMDLIEMTKEIRIKSIEIGESRGFSKISFIIKPEEKDLICYGPADFDFYGLLKENGIFFGI